MKRESDEEGIGWREDQMERRSGEEEIRRREEIGRREDQAERGSSGEGIK